MARLRHCSTLMSLGCCRAISSAAFRGGQPVARVGVRNSSDGGGVARLGYSGLNTARWVRGSVLPGVGAGRDVVFRGGAS